MVSRYVLYPFVAFMMAVMGLATTSSSHDTAAGDPEARKIGPAGWTAYVDPTAGFRIGYPHGFVVQPQDVARFAQFTPPPVASIFFMNPTMATGALAGIEPPDLEVRIYHAEAMDSLERWLASVGFAFVDSGSVVQLFRHANGSGLQVCQSTLLAPGCAVYVLHNGRVYQLTPLSRAGEVMMTTFALLP